MQLKYRSATGEERFWTLKEIVQGRPLRHPSHPMFIHFPIAYYIAALAFDVMSRIHANPALVLAATLLIIGAFAGTVFALVTGLVDWWGMVSGSRKRRWTTKHMLLQLTAFSFFVVVLALRWTHRHDVKAHWLWIVLEIIGVLVLSVGQWFGGVLVYEMAMRVHTGRTEES